MVVSGNGGFVVMNLGGDCGVMEVVDGIEEERRNKMRKGERR